MNLVFKVARRILSEVDRRIKAIKTHAIRKSREKYAEQHQLTSTTKQNRYPKIFNAARTYCEINSPKIMSFGCSTGEECFSLRDYFPTAEIIGVDINVSNLKNATRKNRDANIRFVISKKDNLQKQAPYNIIFAMSVLCRWEETRDIENCAQVYPFEKFEDTIQSLYHLLANGGFMVVYNSNFLIEETQFKDNLKPCIVDEIEESGFVHKFNRNNNKVYTHHNVVIYKKHEDIL